MKKKRRFAVVCGLCGEGIERGDGEWWHVEDVECTEAQPSFKSPETPLSVTV